MKKEKNFDKNGLAVLNEAVECKIIEKLNNEYELVISYPCIRKRRSIFSPLMLSRLMGGYSEFITLTKTVKQGW